MKSQSIRNRILWGVGANLSLLICYILSRHDVLGQWHYMKQWPLIFCIIGLIVAIVAAVLYRRKVMVCTVAGYMVGFILAMLFNSDFVGTGDTIDTMSYNNAWEIWTGAYLVIITAGIIWEILNQRAKGRKGTA